jgi:hypothetical protein
MPSVDAYFKSIGYEPFREQWSFHRSKARFRVATCGRRFGKSTMAARDAIPKHVLIPDGYVWLVGPNYGLGEKEFRVIWKDLIIKKKFGRDKRVKKAYNVRQGDMFIAFPWGARVEVKSAENPDSLVGEGLHHVIMCEAAKHKQETWDRLIRPALTDFHGSADFPTTPEGFNWIYDLFGFGRDPTLPDYESWKFPSWANSHIYPGGETDSEIELLRATMDPAWFSQEIAADFASFVGRIFPDWDEFLHIRPYVFNPAWKNYITIDFGYTNPLAIVEFQVSPDDRIFVWRVYYKSYKTLIDAIGEYKAQDNPPGYHVNMGFADPADPEGVIVAGQQFGFPFYAPKELKSLYTWLDGIMLMRDFMRADREVSQDEYGTPEYEPSFFVDPSCRAVTKEFSNYRSKDPIKGRNVPELGNKVEDHTIDALRYALVCLYKMGASYSLADVMTEGATELVELSSNAKGVERGAPNRTSELIAANSRSATSIMDLDSDMFGSHEGSIFGGTFTMDKDF